MNTKTIVAVVIGGITLFLLGGLIYGLLLADVMTFEGMKDPPDFIFLVLGEFTFAVLLVWAATRTGVSTPVTGAKYGAIIGFLLALGVGLSFYATTNLAGLSVYLIDTVVTAARFAVAGAAIGWWLGRGEDGEAV